MSAVTNTVSRSFKPGDQVRTPSGHVGTVVGIIQSRGAVEIDVEITSLERLLQGELEHADPGAIARLGELQQQTENLRNNLSHTDRARHEAATRASTLEREKAELQRKLSRPKKHAKKSAKKR